MTIKWQQKHNNSKLVGCVIKLQEYAIPPNCFSINFLLSLQFEQKKARTYMTKVCSYTLTRNNNWRQTQKNEFSNAAKRQPSKPTFYSFKFCNKTHKMLWTFLRSCRFCCCIIFFFIINNPTSTLEFKIIYFGLPWIRDTR